LQRDNAANNVKLAALIEPTRGMSIEQLAENRGAVELGHRLYQDNCAACHGLKAHGNHAIGAPDLTDADWLYGGSGDTILTSILDGRSGAMPPWEAILGHDGVNAVASYVLSRNGVQVPEDWVAAGKPRYDSLCAACHAADGRGNPALGAPSLVDRAWLYGSDFATVVASISAGRNGVMPAWRTRLSSDEARVIAAWVFAQSRHEAAAK
jgi:cytochrome c oxidase cbb3-type subunit 3